MKCIHCEMFNSLAVGHALEKHRLQDGNSRLGSWMSAALDDPLVCDEMKSDIRAWFESQSGGAPYPADRDLVVENSQLRAALERAEKAEEFHKNCPECEGEGIAEECWRCFGLADDARTMRWVALGMAK